MTRLTKYEKETILLTSEDDDTWTIYTFHAPLKRRLKDYATRYPDLCRKLEEKGAAPGAVSYEIQKSRLSLRLLPPVSAERKEAIRKVGMTKGFGAERPTG